MALLSVSPTQVGIAYQLLSYWESSAGGLNLVGYNLEGSKIQVKVTRFTSQVGEFEGPALDRREELVIGFVVVVHWICRFNLRFQFETTWSASINILLAAA